MNGVFRGMVAAVALGLPVVGWTSAARAEAWVQIEAKSSRAEAEARVRDWAESLPGVTGQVMPGGWYAITIGPFATQAEAEARLNLLRGEKLIPGDSYVADGRAYRGRFGAESPAPQAGQSAAPAAPPAAPAPQATPETAANAPRTEADLSLSDRQDVQTALQWAGFYSGTIDGALGRGSRAAIAAWQAANGAEASGVLTGAQIDKLLGTFRTERDALGLQPETESEAGISIDLPLGLVEFDHYDPPFVHYREKAGSGVKVLLISRQGDQTALAGLYEAMQTLEIVPLEGERSRDRSGFVLTGQNDQIHSHTEARLQGGLIKGFTLVYPAKDSARMARVLAAMKASFRPTGDRALDEGLGQPLTVAREALMAGLDVRHPALARSGFYIDAKGSVLTLAEGIAQCARLTIDGAEADLAFTDAATGIAVLTPRKALAPARVARFQTAAPRAGAEVAVAGYSYPEALSAPVLTFGKLSDLTGLAGEADQARLAMATLPGDTGGPVLDTTGAVIGVLLPQGNDPARVLPADLSIARQGAAVAHALDAKGLAPDLSDGDGALAAEDLVDRARAMTVQVACWN